VFFIPIGGGDGSAKPFDDGAMDNFDDLEQLRADVLDVFPPGSQRDVWLA
jgi:hypothetical protein